jgi:hypothetical protein
MFGIKKRIEMAEVVDLMLDTIQNFQTHCYRILEKGGTDITSSIQSESVALGYSNICIAVSTSKLNSEVKDNLIGYLTERLSYQIGNGTFDDLEFLQERSDLYAQVFAANPLSIWVVFLENLGDKQAKSNKMNALIGGFPLEHIVKVTEKLNDTNTKYKIVDTPLEIMQKSFERHFR